MLPKNRDEDKYRGDEDQRERYLRDGTGWEWLDIALVSLVISFFVPSWECCQQEKAHKGKDNGDNTAVQLVAVRVLTPKLEHLQKVWEHDAVLECVCDKDQVERILIDTDLLRKC